MWEDNYKFSNDNQPKNTSLVSWGAVLFFIAYSLVTLFG
jgi:hypothetical protein